MHVVPNELESTSSFNLDGVAWALHILYSFVRELLQLQTLGCHPYVDPSLIPFVLKSVLRLCLICVISLSLSVHVCLSVCLHLIVCVLDSSCLGFYSGSKEIFWPIQYNFR